MQVPMNPAESLLNYIVHHTDLYMRTKRRETPAEHDARWRAAFYALQPWLHEYRQKIRDEVTAELQQQQTKADKALKHIYGDDA